MTRPTAPHDPDDFELIDVAQARNWGQFVLHSVGRRKLIAFSAALLTLLATAALIFVLPKTYHVEAQLLAQRNTVMPALGNPGRTVPVEADTPTRAAAETVLRRDNLLNLMKQTDLLNRWELDRNPALRIKDVVVNAISPPSEEDRLNAMIGLLEKRLTVTTGDSTVTIAIDWPNAQLGFKLVDTALQNFLEQRHTAEVATIAETITILEGHAANLRDAIDSTMEDLKRARDPATKGRAPEAPVLRRDPAQEALKAEAAETRVLLDAKRRSITELEDFRRRRLAELQTELAQQRAVYADAHPAVAKILQSISALQQDSPQLAALRKDESDLQVEYEKINGRRQENTPLPALRSTDPSRRKPSDGPDLQGEYGRTRLRFAMEKYDGLLERIDSARIELDTARAAFKYRYSVIRPPTLPRRAEKPKIPLLVAAGLMASVGMAFALATLADLRSGKVLEPWQVERRLGLSVLGVIPRA